MEPVWILVKWVYFFHAFVFQNPPRYGILYGRKQEEVPL